MSREYWVMAALAVGAIALVAVAGGRRWREKLFLFVAGQMISWPATIFLVYMGRIESPVRLFPKATDSNFVLAFVAFPAVFAAYYFCYPRHNSRVIRIGYSLAVTGGGALLHVAVQKYTRLLTYIDFSGYVFWLIMLVNFYVLRIYADWYLSQWARRQAGDPR